VAKRNSGSDDVELIEIFAADESSVWSDATSFAGEPFAAPNDRPPSRRGVVLVALSALAVGAVGITALIDDDTAETATTTTTEVTSTTERSLLDPASRAYYLIHDETLTPYSADIVTPPPNGQQVQVWTNGTPVGPIVIIELQPYRDQPYGIVGATREIVGGVDLVRPTARPDTLMAALAVDDVSSLTIRAVGLTGEEVVRIIGGVRVVDGELADELDVMQELALGLTFEDESVNDLIFGRVETEVRYLTAEGKIVTLRSAVGSSEHRLAALRYLTTDSLPFYGSSRLPNGDAIVVWEDDGRLLSLTTPLAPDDIIPDELIRMSRAVRPATDSEWRAMLYGLRPDFRLGDFESLATGHASSTELWSAGPQITQRNGRTEFLWWWTVPGYDDFTDSAPASLEVGTRPRFDTVVVPGATFVFVSQPGEGGTVTVRTATGAEFVAELIRPFEQSEVWMTVVHVEEPGPVTVRINSYEVRQ
jgi:hypothetical protein